MKIFSLYKEYISNCRTVRTKPVSKKDFEKVEHAMKNMSLTGKPYLVYSSQIDDHWVYFVMKRDRLVDAKIISLSLLNTIRQYGLEVNK